MNARQLTTTAAEWASIRTEGDPATFSATGGRMVRTLWLVARGNEHWLMAPDEPKLISATPPVEFVQACAPCPEPMCRGGVVLYPEWEGNAQPCPDCRIELVGPCPDCADDPDYKGEFALICTGCHGDKTVTLGHAYAVGQPLPIVGEHDEYLPNPRVEVTDQGMVILFVGPIATDITGRLAHYGPPESLVGKWALRLEVVGS